MRRYVEERLLHVSRRYVKKFGDPEVGTDVVGYKSFSEVCRDLDVIVNVLWLSGTRKSNVFACQAIVKGLTGHVFASWSANPLSA